MGRSARIVMPGWAHHITQRGNHRQTVFLSEQDRRIYFEHLAKYKNMHHISLLGYSLMTNHVHHAAIPEYSNSLAKGYGRTHNDYSRWFNMKLNRTGHLWQGRFYSCAIDDESLAEVMAYIELNPVRAGIVKKAEDWEWSSARAHLSGIDETGLLNMDWCRRNFTPDSWGKLLKEKGNDPAIIRKIRTATQTGRPLAKTESIRRIEHRKCGQSDERQLH